MLMHREGILHPLDAAKLSDSTLRSLCPPAFMALNEPENSLHPDLLPALAQLLAEHTEIRHYQLHQVDGATQVVTS